MFLKARRYGEKVVGKLRTGASPRPACHGRIRPPTIPSLPIWRPSLIVLPLSVPIRAGQAFIVSTVPNTPMRSRDLVALEIDSGTLLPPDESAYGFDKLAAVLSVSPLLLEGIWQRQERSVVAPLEIPMSARSLPPTRSTSFSGKMIA